MVHGTLDKHARMLKTTSHFQESNWWSWNLDALIRWFAYFTAMELKKWATAILIHQIYNLGWKICIAKHLKTAFLSTNYGEMLLKVKLYYKRNKNDADSCEIHFSSLLQNKSPFFLDRITRNTFRWSCFDFKTYREGHFLIIRRPFTLFLAKPDCQICQSCLKTNDLVDFFLLQ